jgi:hypothetical protein
MRANFLKIHNVNKHYFSSSLTMIEAQLFHTTKKQSRCFVFGLPWNTDYLIINQWVVEKNTAYENPYTWKKKKGRTKIRLKSTHTRATAITQYSNLLCYIANPRNWVMWKELLTQSIVISKKIRDNKRRHSACFAYLLKDWAHCATE